MTKKQATRTCLEDANHRSRVRTRVVADQKKSTKKVSARRRLFAEKVSALEDRMLVNANTKIGWGVDQRPRSVDPKEWFEYVDALYDELYCNETL